MCVLADDADDGDGGHGDHGEPAVTNIFQKLAGGL